MTDFIKKVIVVALLSELSIQDFIDSMMLKCQGLIAKLLQFPSVNPTAASVLVKVTALQTLKNDREALLLQAQQKTKDIKAAIKDLNDTTVDKWCGQVETDAAGDIGLIKSVNFGVKFEDETPPAISIGNSKPIITGSDINRHLEHTITVKNSQSGRIGLPEDALRCDVYEYIGDTPPSDYKKWTVLGSLKWGKITNHFSEDQVGQSCNYVCIYVPLPSATGSSELSGKIKLQII